MQLSLDKTDYPGLKGLIKGILFFSTPHRGSDSTKWPDLLTSIAEAAIPGVPSLRNDLIKSLGRDSDDLQKFSNDWQNQIGGIKIFSLVEMNVTPPLTSRPALYVKSVSIHLDHC